MSDVDAKIHFRQFCRRSAAMKLIIFLFSFLLIAQPFANAHIGPPIDKAGGHFNEKSGKYHYHFPSKRGIDMNPNKVKRPKQAEPQEIYGVVTRITDTKSVWVKVSSRQSYMILAESLSKSNRNDKDREIRVLLKFVSPMASVASSSFDTAFRRKWKSYVIKILQRELLTARVKVSVTWQPKSGQFIGMVFKTISGPKGSRSRNINLWMIYSGLSYYLIEHGRAYQDKEFIKAQDLARTKRLGLWGY